MIRFARVLALIVVPLCAMPAQGVKHASFDLSVAKSEAVPLGKHHLDMKGAYVTYTNEFFGARQNAIKIQLFAEPLSDESLARLAKNDNDSREISEGGFVAIVLLLDKADQIAQVNMTFTVPGTTVARTVAYTREVLAKAFSDYRYENHRLHLKSGGALTEPASGAESLSLIWNVELDVPVVDHIKK